MCAHTMPAYRRSQFGCEPDCAPGYVHPKHKQGTNLELILTVIVAVVAVAALVFAVMAWHEARQASDFAYNAEAFTLLLTARLRADAVCGPLLGEGPADAEAADFIGSLPAPDQLAACRAVAAGDDACPALDGLTPSDCIDPAPLVAAACACSI